MAATDLTFLELQDRVLSFGYGEVDRARVKMWINMAYSDIMSRRRWRWAQATQSVVTVAGTATVALSALSDPPQFFGRLAPVTASAREPVYLDAMQFNDNVSRRPPITSRGLPDTYTIFGDTITFYPTPDAAYTYTLHYWKGATDLSADGDKPIIPRQWRTVLVYGALRYAAERDRNDNSLARRTAEYEKWIANMIGADNLSQSETGARSEMPGGYYGLFDDVRPF